MNRFRIRALGPLEVANLTALAPDLPDVAGDAGLWLSSVRRWHAGVDRTCFLATQGPVTIGYLLAFVHAGEAHCTALRVREGCDTRRIAAALRRHLMSNLGDHDTRSCRFPPEPRPVA